MTKPKTPSVPDVHVLRGLMEEYLEMLQEAERAGKRVLSLSTEKEEFWDQLTELASRLSMIEARSNSIQEEIDDLIDQLPED
jgi:predicted  nucleic acid-binding Zn-ribbon protein